MHKAKVYRARRPRSVMIGSSEIRPISGAVSESKESQRANGTFTPGGNYQLEKFPALKNLLKKSWDLE
ncbi:MAG TPA: hypothetical protein VGD58_08090 [Herpetosiphonaceae bacterium]